MESRDISCEAEEEDSKQVEMKETGDVYMRTRESAKVLKATMRFGAVCEIVVFVCTCSRDVAIFH